MKYETRAPSMHYRGQLKILSNPLPSPGTLGIFKPIPSLSRDIQHYTPHVHTRHTSIMMAPSTSTSSHLNDIINHLISKSSSTPIIIPFQYHPQHHQSPHLNITNITSNHIPYIYIHINSCLRFTFPIFSPPSSASRKFC